MKEFFPMDDKEGFSYNPPPEETSGLTNPPHESPLAYRSILTRPQEAMPVGGAAPAPANETITIETANGSRRIQVPADPNQKIEMVEIALNRMEQTRQSEGGPGIKQLVERVNRMVNGLITPEYQAMHTNPADPNFGIGERLYQEFIARYYFHETFVNYDGAGSIEEVQKAVSLLQGDHLNTLFSFPEFIYFLNEYEKHGEDFSLKNAPEFRARMLEEAGQLGAAAILKPEDARTPEEAAVAGKPLEDLESYRNRAERFWQITGRRATQDTTVIEGDYATTGKYGFDDDVVGGNFAMRRLLRWKDWAKSQVKAFKLKLQVVEGIDLQQNDYYEELMRKDAVKPAIYVTQVKEASVKESADPNVPERIITIPARRINFFAVDWKKFDFSREFNNNPMANWAFQKLAQPEKARDALTNGSDSLIRNPLPETLFKLKDAFAYQGTGDPKEGRDSNRETKAKLLLRLIDFLRKDNEKEMKRGNIVFEQKDKIIYDAVQQNYITADELPAVEEKALGPIRGVRRAGYLFNFLEFLRGVFDSVREQIIKNK